MRIKKQAALLAVAGLATAGLATITAAPAQAAVIGSLALTPTTGNATSLVTANSSGACDNGTNIKMTVAGTGVQSASENIVGNSPISAYSTNGSGGITVPSAYNLTDFGNLQSPALTSYNGRYDFTLVCKAAVGATTYGTFTGGIYFTSSTAYHTTKTSTVVSGAQTSPTTNTASLSATVSGSVTPVGTVQFQVDGTNVGTPVAVNGSGVATTVTGALSVASHTVDATFIPATTEFDGSSATQGSFVTATPFISTTTTLTADKASPVTPGTAITLTAALTPSGATGTVAFKDNGSTISGCSAVSVSAGQAQCVYTPAAEENAVFTAAFTGSGQYYDSTSGNVAITVSNKPAATEDIVTKVTAQGALVISVNGCSYPTPRGSAPTGDGPATGPLSGASGTVSSTNNTSNPCNDVVLPSPTLDGSGQLLTTSGSLKPITITDTRTPDSPWAFTGQVDDFATFGGANTFKGSGLGWSPSVTSTNVNGTTVVAGPTVAGDSGLVFTSNGGLKTARAFAYTSSQTGTAGTASSPTGSGLGSTVLGGTLTLNVPTNTVPGVYLAHLTLTAI
ncbi:MAG TPA: hypothetical protein DHW34_02040 [Actinobacteria bacterium]|nr:hypothetical protein [Actinomycetota bacterium]HCK78776.1 hypothetical protein [Actinomycetota bacterium]